MAVKWALRCAVPSSDASRSVALITRLGTHNQLLVRQYAWAAVREHQRLRHPFLYPRFDPKSLASRHILRRFHTQICISFLVPNHISLEANRSRQRIKEKNELNGHFDLMNYTSGIKILESKLHISNAYFLGSIFIQYFHHLYYFNGVIYQELSLPKTE